MNLSVLELEFLHESNMIEGVTDADSLLQAVKAWEYLKSKTKIDLGVMLKTHEILMANQDLKPEEKGAFRKCAVYIGGHEAMDWREIVSALQQWVKDSEQIAVVVAHLGFSAEDFHIKYEKIHPFVDGNGRTGRMFMNWQKLKIGLPVLIIKNSEKQYYYNWFK